MEFVNNKKRKEQANEIEVLKKALIKKGVLTANDIEKERPNK